MSSINLSSISGGAKLALPYAVWQFSSISGNTGSVVFSDSANKPISSNCVTLVNSSTGTTAHLGNKIDRSDCRAL